jgi:hypothetical protein
MDLGPVSSVVQCRRNGPLIALAASLWIRPHDTLMDATFGRGLFHADYAHPGPLIKHDLGLDGVDFRQLPEADNSIDVVLYDPPYTSIGGRATSTMTDFNDRYGLAAAPATPEELRVLIAAGVKECARVLTPGGRLLAKTMDYISSGRYQCGLQHLFNCGVDADLDIVDLFIHHSGMGPQPKKNLDGSPRRQVHSRRAHSYLVVLKKPGGS